jgi:hypothetical protein
VPEQETNLATLGLMAGKLQAANPNAFMEGLSLGEGALRDVYDLKHPITGKIQNGSCLVLGAC